MEAERKRQIVILRNVPTLLGPGGEIYEYKSLSPNPKVLNLTRAQVTKSLNLNRPKVSTRAQVTKSLNLKRPKVSTRAQVTKSLNLKRPKFLTRAQKRAHGAPYRS
jgi:hypothetical protein